MQVNQEKKKREEKQKREKRQKKKEEQKNMSADLDVSEHSESIGDLFYLYFALFFCSLSLCFFFSLFVSSLQMVHLLDMDNITTTNTTTPTFNNQ